MITSSKSDQETQLIAKKLVKTLLGQPDYNEVDCGLICLYGDLGAGKTTFVKGIASALGILECVQSPTFTYQRIYKNFKGKKLYHYDCYRFEDGKIDPLFVSEIVEILGKNDAIVAIEWAERIAEFLPESRVDVHFEHLDEKTRKISIAHKKSKK